MAKIVIESTVDVRVKPTEKGWLFEGPDGREFQFIHLELGIKMMEKAYANSVYKQNQR